MPKLSFSSRIDSFRADIWIQSHPKSIRHYRADEHREASNRRQLRRARRRLLE